MDCLERPRVIAFIRKSFRSQKYSGWDLGGSCGDGEKCFDSGCVTRTCLMGCIWGEREQGRLHVFGPTTWRRVPFAEVEKTPGGAGGNREQR